MDGDVAKAVVEAVANERRDADESRNGVTRVAALALDEMSEQGKEKKGIEVAWAASASYGSQGLSAAPGASASSSSAAVPVAQPPDPWRRPADPKAPVQLPKRCSAGTELSLGAAHMGVEEKPCVNCCEEAD